MASAARIPFNPSTADTRFNSLRHGAASKELFIPGEDPDVFFAALRDNFRYYKPLTEQQAQLVEDATFAHWLLARRQRAHAINEHHLYTAKPDITSWTTEDLNRMDRFDRYKAEAERSLQRALANVRSFHKDNLRTRQWQELHDLKIQKFALQRERFELAKAREQRLAAKHATDRPPVANNDVSGFRSVKNDISSPTESPADHPSAQPVQGSTSYNGGSSQET